MSEVKYYTPKAHEYHLGFEYEYHFNDNALDTWVKTEFTGSTFRIFSDKFTVRVKHLDHDDIVSLGWELAWSNNYQIVEIGSDISIYKYGLTVYSDNKVSISNDNCETIFSGHLRNKSELKRLMRQLHITK